MRGMFFCFAAVLALAACEEKAKRVYFDGHLFNAKASGAKGDREKFVVSVRRADKSLKGAREAGRHEAVKYCIKNFGSSDIDWVNGPDAEQGTLRFKNGSLVLSGQCGVW